MSAQSSHQNSIKSNMRRTSSEIDAHTVPFPPLPTSLVIDKACTALAIGEPSVFTSTDAAVGRIVTQATTGFLVTELTDNLLQRSVDVPTYNYYLFVEIARLLCSVPLKRSHMITLIKKTIEQKESIWAYCADLKTERAVLREELGIVFPGESLIDDVEPCGLFHPVNSRLYQQLCATPFPTPWSSSIQMVKSNKRSGDHLEPSKAKRIKLSHLQESSDGEVVNFDAEEEIQTKIDEKDVKINTGKDLEMKIDEEVVGYEKDRDDGAYKQNEKDEEYDGDDEEIEEDMYY